jgi:ribonucleoside-diphosphate reductase alpha chain
MLGKVKFMGKKNNGDSKKSKELVSASMRRSKALLEVKFNTPRARRKKGRKGREFFVENVLKSDGRTEPFSWKKIEKSVIYAGRDTKAFGKRDANKILKKVHNLVKKVKTKTVSSYEIRDLVEPVMAEEGYFQTARYYILYKERKEQVKKGEFKVWEPKMDKNARLTLVSRCARHDPDGKPQESPGQIFWRVARHLAKAEINWGNESDVEKISRVFFEKMANFKFVCTRSALYEAGNKDCSQQLSPCFVLKIEDSIPSIFKTLGEAALVQKNYGGTGFNFSNIRYKGDKVRNVPNAASGPVDFLQVYSAALSRVVQGAKRHGGNMGILDVDHPDIYDFIAVKDVDGFMKNFNVSVGVTDDFMDTVVSNKRFVLRNPRDGKKVKSVSSKKLFHDICEHAHRTGDPGMIFLDRMEADNYTPTLGTINATNPCGEQPLLPYESCNLSSVHLANHLVKKNGKWEVDWDDLEDTVKALVRFLDNMIEVNSYVLAETEKIVRHGNRKIGLGVIGFGETLFKLKVAYNSREGVRIADRVAKFIKRKAEEASLELAKTRGVFPNWDISTYKGTAERYRNCTMVTIAPTGTVSMIGNTTSGIEPSFALVYTRRSFYNEDSKNRSTAALFYIDPTFEKVLKEKGLYSKKLVKKVAVNGGSIQKMREIPTEIRRVFVTTHDIAPEWHVRIQAAFQKYADNAVSKTVNFSHGATIEDVKKAYMLAWKLGCKGITIYRDGSREDQVLTTGVKKSTNGESNLKVKTASGVKQDQVQKVCPECEGVLFFEGGCATCRDCGWSKCKT